MRIVRDTSKISMWQAIKRSTFILLLMMPVVAYAQSKEFGLYTVYYSAFTADLLTPSVAKEYQVPRSKNRAILNISVRKKQAGGLTKPSYATLNITVANLSQQLKTLEAREIASKDAIYYIAETTIDDAEVLKYNIEVLPEDGSTPYTFSFSEEFYID